jgi:hypothetical protein
MITKQYSYWRPNPFFLPRSAASPDLLVLLSEKLDPLVLTQLTRGVPYYAGKLQSWDRVEFCGLREVCVYYVDAKKLRNS